MTPGQGERARQDLGLADQALRVARLALEAGAREDTASRAYYAVFHASRAALTVRGAYAKTHGGNVTLFNETFGAAPVLGRLLQLRGAADYEPARFNRSAAQLRSDIDDAAVFLERCRGIVDQALAEGPDEPDPPPDL